MRTRTAFHSDMETIRHVYTSCEAYGVTVVGHFEKKSNTQGTPGACSPNDHKLHSPQKGRKAKQSPDPPSRAGDPHAGLGAFLRTAWAGPHIALHHGRIRVVRSCPYQACRLGSCNRFLLKHPCAQGHLSLESLLSCNRSSSHSHILRNPPPQHVRPGPTTWHLVATSHR